ncbi:MAG: sodium:calcium antiporter [Parcubacteria group bacterium]|nr:sodium:calcium antiporter [Parcubacteria group bacterium]
MPIILNDLVKFALAFLILAYSSRILVRSLANMARFLQVSDYAISFILMGFATSIPELFVAISSGINDAAALSFGNIIGANILNVTLLLGIIALAAGGIPNRDQSIKTDAWLIFVIAVMPLLLLWDGNLDRPDGLVLILLYLWYLNRLFVRQKVLGRALNHFGRKFRGGGWVLKETAIFVLGIVLLLAASAFVVTGAENLTKVFGLDLGIFGILIVAIGTTVPELSFGLRSVLHKHEQMTLGNAIGSVAVNSTLILGLLALISPFRLEYTPNIKLSVAALIVSLWLFNIFLTNEKPTITRKEGVILIVVYFVFAILSWVTGL